MKFRILEKEGFIGLEISLSPRIYLSQKIDRWGPDRAYNFIKRKNQAVQRTSDTHVITNSATGGANRATWWFPVDLPAPPPKAARKPSKKATTRAKRQTQKKKPPMRSRIKNLSKQINESKENDSRKED